MWESSHASQRPASLRPFGRAEDLDIDFSDEDRPALVTALLAVCDSDGHGSEAWWQRSVAARTAALLHLLDVSEPGAGFDLNARCDRPACGETFEFSLPLAALPLAQPTASSLRLQLDRERHVRLRRPTGSDLRRWRASRPATRQAAVAAMLADLWLSGDVQPDDEAPLSEALADADPLVAFTVACHCPACDAAQQVSVDLEGLALFRLGAKQRELTRQVHRLASHYGWTEAEVLELTPARRGRYLALIEAEAV